MIFMLLLKIYFHLYSAWLQTIIFSSVLKCNIFFKSKRNKTERRKNWKKDNNVKFIQNEHQKIHKIVQEKKTKLLKIYRCENKGNIINSYEFFSRTNIYWLLHHLCVFFAINCNNLKMGCTRVANQLKKNIVYIHICTWEAVPKDSWVLRSLSDNQESYPKESFCAFFDVALPENINNAIYV